MHYPSDLIYSGIITLVILYASKMLIAIIRPITSKIKDGIYNLYFAQKP
jgi:hypothetical protein